MWWGCVQAIADVHALDWRALNLDKLLMPDRGESSARAGGRLLQPSMLQWASAGRPRAELAKRPQSGCGTTFTSQSTSACAGVTVGCPTSLYGPQFEVAAVVDWEIAYIGDHEADLAWLLFTDWGLSEYQGVPRLDGTPAARRNH